MQGQPEVLATTALADLYAFSRHARVKTVRHREHFCQKVIRPFAHDLDRKPAGIADQRVGVGRLFRASVVGGHAMCGGGFLGHYGHSKARCRVFPA